MKLGTQPLFQDNSAEDHKSNLYSAEFNPWIQLRYPTPNPVTFSATPPTAFPNENFSLQSFWPSEEYLNSLTSSACLPVNSYPMDFTNSLSSMVSVPVVPIQKVDPITPIGDCMMNNYNYMAPPSSFIETSYISDLLLSDSNSSLTASPPQYPFPIDYTPYPLSNQTQTGHIEPTPQTKTKKAKAPRKLKSTATKEMKNSASNTTKLTKLERNRIAASKCRQKTKKWQEETLQIIERNTKENEILEGELMELRQQIMDLKILLASSTCDKAI